ncbi:uncharacterized protein DFL_004345 [Arthrobotrys flagrans]|uniref:Uncharacterized protein n=1 Tax=Arthrobotrys flagrans TaxID=97331 RepID=A0A437A4E2_ARTFL|nr:hypothetical protein DFL_004345 [Arthrobotrys flagrans]
MMLIPTTATTTRKQKEEEEAKAQGQEQDYDHGNRGFELSLSDNESIGDLGCTTLPLTLVTITNDYDCTIITSSQREMMGFRASKEVLSISSPVLDKLFIESKASASSADESNKTQIEDGEFPGVGEGARLDSQ